MTATPYLAAFPFFNNRAWPTRPLRTCQLPLLLVCIFILPVAVNAQSRPPVLLSQPTSTRAIAFEVPTYSTEPFSPASRVRWGSDSRTRITLFALNLSLQPNEPLSAVTVQAEDVNHRGYNFAVEYVGQLPEQPSVSTVIVRLSEDLTNVGDVLVRLSYHGLSSNRVRVGIGQVGGGLLDDPGAGPATVPPYLVAGHVTASAAGFGGVTVRLSGPQPQTTTTDSSGFFAFTVSNAGENYVVTVEKTFYNFGPTARTFNSLTNSLTNLDFIGTPQTFPITGQVKDDSGNQLAGIPVALINDIGGTIGTTVTNSAGSYSFPNLIAGLDYTVAPAGTDFISFTSQNSGLLSGNSVLNFNATRRTYQFHGRLFTSANAPLAGALVNLTGSQNATTTTDSNGNYSFAGLVAGGNYSVSPVSGPIYDFTTESVANVHGDQIFNFTGTLRSYAINGHVSNGASAFAGLSVVLSGAATRTTTTDANGDFSFMNLPAGEAYKITPAKPNYTVAPAFLDIASLTANVTAQFNGSLNQYVLSGRITDAPDHGLGGVEVALGGSSTGSMQTAADGSYTFTVPAEGNYTITPAKPYYLFSPAAQVFNNLGGNQLVDFDGALRTYVINGRVTDGVGHPIVGIKMNLGGAQTISLRTNNDGRYSFEVPATLDYSLTPSIEQDRYHFIAPSQNFNNLIADQSADFVATLQPIPSPAYVLEYDGLQKTVDYGDFWQPYVDLGNFFWEFWAMPGNNAGATYLLSDGYGGAHALLFGFTGSSNPGHYNLAGNTWDGYVAGQHKIDFGSDDGPAVGEWGHFAVGWDGQNIITYFNGVPVGKKAFTGPRATPGYGGGGGRLLIGGSDHANLSGRIAQVRGYEGTNPHANGNNDPEATFTPETVFGLGANLLSHYFRPGPVAADVSNGFDGLLLNGPTHPGTLRGTTNGILYECTNCPPPLFVIDPTAPDFSAGTPGTPIPIASPAPVPPGARVFDSFSRASSTYIFGSMGGLGSTEGGSDGVLVWQTNIGNSEPQPFGILNGRGVLLANQRSLAWVTTSSTTGDLDVRVARQPGASGSGLDTGLAFRVVDANNFFFAYTAQDGQSAQRALTVGYYQGGARFELASGISLPNFITLRAVTSSDGNLKIYADATQVYSGSNTSFASAPGAGIYNNQPGAGLVMRWDNFLVYDYAPSRPSATPTRKNLVVYARKY